MYVVSDIMLTPATNPCAAVQCLKGSRCEVFEPTGEPFCTPSCAIDNGGCPDGQICTIQDVTCVRAPCPNAVKCSEFTVALTLNTTCYICKLSIGYR